MRRVAVALGLALAMAAPAAAQNGKIVASADGFDLYARHGAHGRVCLSVLGRSTGTSDGPCERVFSAFHPLQTSTYGRRAAIGLAVPEPVTRVTAGEREFDTVAVEGFGVRFALLPQTRADQLLRLYDSGGELVGAARDPYADARLRGATPVFKVRGARVSAKRSDDLEPTPLVFDRTVPKTCLKIRVQHSGTDVCTQDRDLERLDLDVATACAPARSVLYGLVSPRVRRIEAVLGSGRTFTVRTRPLPKRLGPGRAVAASLPRGEAVRSARSLDAGGSVIGRVTVGVPPGGLPCPDAEGGSSTTLFAVDTLTARSGKPVAPPVVVAAAGGRSLRAADGAGTDLCVALTAQRRFACETPPVDAVFTFARQRGRVVSGVLSKDVATVTLELDTNTTIQAETTEGPAYAGRYAGRVRFLAIELPAGASVRRAIPRDSEGRSIGQVYVSGSGATHRTRRRLRPGLVVVHESRPAGGEGEEHETCVRPRHPLTEIGSVGICSSLASFATQAMVSVPCAPRRAVVFGALPRTVRAVTLRLAGGDRLRPRVRRVRGLGRIWSAVLPRHEQLRALRYTGKLGTRPLRVLPAARQCGYEDQDYVF